MAHFYGEVKGRGKNWATQCGNKSTGISGNIAGWNIGACVDIFHNEENGLDYLEVALTSGSNKRYTSKIILRVTEKEAEQMFIDEEVRRDKIRQEDWGDVGI